MNRVSTFTTTTNLFSQTQRLQTNYAMANAQSSSGLKSETFTGISSDAQQLLAVSTQTNNLVAQSLVIKSAQTRINGLQNVMGTIADTINNANALFSTILGGVDTTSATGNIEQARVIRDELASLLNTQVGGSYLFGGSINDRAPVNLSDPAYDPTVAPTTPDTDYYQGNSSVEDVRASDSLRVSYGITADNSAFEKAFRALNLFIADPTNATTQKDAFDLIKSSILDVAQITGTLIAKSTIITNEANINGATIDYLTQVASGLRDADTAAAAVTASQIETQLQASYSSLAKLLNLRLSDYLR